MNEMTTNIKDFFSKNFFVIAAFAVSLIGTYFTVEDNTDSIVNLNMNDGRLESKIDGVKVDAANDLDRRMKTFYDYRDEHAKEYKKKEQEYQIIIFRLTEQLHKQDKEIVALQKDMEWLKKK